MQLTLNASANQVLNGDRITSPFKKADLEKVVIFDMSEANQYLMEQVKFLPAIVAKGLTYSSIVTDILHEVLNTGSASASQMSDQIYAILYSEGLVDDQIQSFIEQINSIVSVLTDIVETRVQSTLGMDYVNAHEYYQGYYWDVGHVSGYCYVQMNLFKDLSDATGVTSGSTDHIPY